MTQSYPAILAAESRVGKATAMLRLLVCALTRAGRAWYSFSMATESSAALSDPELLYQFIGRRLENDGRNESLDLILADFAEYRRQLEKLRAMIREAEESSARGESKPLDVEDVIRRGRERMAAEGIID
jgi:hypothetical protein